MSGNGIPPLEKLASRRHPSPRLGDPSRRSQLVKHISAALVATSLLLSFFYFFHLRQDVPPPIVAEPFLPVHRNTPGKHPGHKWSSPPLSGGLDAGGTRLDEVVVSTSHAANLPQVTQLPSLPPPEPIAFSLIMWSENSASEGAILVKSIIMYMSVPVDIHIICDEEAQTYLEHRLKLVERPRHNVVVRFYRLTWEAMSARIEREGRISTVHAAGVPGLMKLFIHELLPPSVTRAIFVDTDAFFISDPLLLWRQFDGFNETTAISLPSHPEMFAPQWFDANKICSCIMLLDLAALRRTHLMASSLAPSTPSLGHAAFAALFGEPDARTGRYEEVALGDQSFWWAIIKHAPELFKHLHFDWEVSSCLLDMYATGLGHDDAGVEDELKAQLHTWATPHQGEAIMPKLVHFNCLDGPRYHEWSGWDDADNSLAQRWAPTVKYHTGYKWLWLNQGTDGAQVRMETVLDVKFADELTGNI